MSVRGLDPTCPSTIKCEPSSPSPSSQGDVSPAQPSPGSSSSDTNSSYGPLIKSHNHSNGLDSPSPYGHSAALAGSIGATRLLVFPTTNSSHLQSKSWNHFSPLCLYGEGLGKTKARWSVSSCWELWPSGCAWCAATSPRDTTTAWHPVRPARPSSRGPSKVGDSNPHELTMFCVDAVIPWAFVCGINKARTGST